MTMISYAKMDAAGTLPLELGRARALPADCMELPGIADPTSLMGRMLVDGVWVDRPRPIVQTDQTGVTTVTLADAPTGTTCRIIDLLTDDLLFAGPAPEAAIWTLPDPGQYAVEIDPPPPWLPVSLRLEVAA
jgi:hypothetical protein